MTWGYRALSTAWSLLRCRIEGVAGCGSIVRERGCSQGRGLRLTCMDAMEVQFQV
jgi:hypothetical protein